MTEPTAAWQLPDGVDELLPEDAWRVEQLRRHFTDCCRHSGYELVMPPLIEYIDSLLTGTGVATSLQTFKMVDQQSGRTLGVRADMTPQVARLDAHAFRTDAPNRLCYTGTVLRARTDGFGGSRTPQQFGAELFGHASVAADIEIIRLMLDTVNVAGLDSAGLVLDLGHVGVYQGLCKAAALNPTQREAMFVAMNRGAAPDVHQLLSEDVCAPGIAKAFTSLLDLRGGADVLDRARSTLLSDEVVADLPEGGADVITAALESVDNVIRALKRSHPNVRIVVDLSELRGYGYHTGMLFAAYTDKGDVLARGGRYDAISAAFGRADRSATGFSGDLTQLARLVAASGVGAGKGCADAAGVFVSNIDGLSDADEASLWANVNQLRQRGERVVLALPDDASEPASFGCTHQLVQLDGGWHVQPNTATSS